MINYILNSADACFYVLFTAFTLICSAVTYLQ